MNDQLAEHKNYFSCFKILPEFKKKLDKGIKINNTGYFENKNNRSLKDVARPALQQEFYFNCLMFLISKRD